MNFKIKDNVTYVGKIDWELRKFHGEEYTTRRGSSYNSYLIKDEKIALVDTIWQPFGREFVQNLRNEIDLNKIDYVVVLHTEVDHSGALPYLMAEIPDTPIYCTTNAKKFMIAQYHQNWNFVEVKSGDRLNLGSRELIFIEARMLHWPDTMFAYMTEDHILFSSDGFGQHYASNNLYNDSVDQGELFQEALKYYANILAPFNKMVEGKINEILKMNLPISMICPSHGVIWRDNPLQIVEKYMEWAKDYQENQVTIIYDTMWNSTRKMAEAISTGILKGNPDLTVKLYNCARTDHTTIAAEAYISKAVLIGSSTVNNGFLPSIAGIIDIMKGMKLKNKKAAAFGSYGWSGEALKLINEDLSHAGFELIDEGLRLTWVPDTDGVNLCEEMGRRIGEALK